MISSEPNKKSYAITPRKFLRNIIPIGFSAAIPATTDAILPKDGDPKDDIFYDIIPFWATVISIAALAIIIHSLTDYLLEKKWPYDPEAKYRIDTNIVNIKIPEKIQTFIRKRNIDTNSLNSEYSSLLSHHRKRPKPYLRYAIRALIPTLIAIGGSLSIDAITNVTSGAKDQLSSNMPVWATTLAIAVIALSIRSGVDNSLEYLWPYDPEQNYCQPSTRILSRPR